MQVMGIINCLCYKENIPGFTKCKKTAFAIFIYDNVHPSFIQVFIVKTKCFFLTNLSNIGFTGI